MSVITKNPNYNQKVHQSTVIVGNNGRPIDAVLTITGQNPLIKQALTALTFNTGVVTVNNSYDLQAVKDSPSKNTGQLILITYDENYYFIDRLSIDDSTKSFNIYSDPDKTTIPASINLSPGWTIAEASFINALRTTSVAQIDEVNFGGFDFHVRLDGKQDSVAIVDGVNKLKINPDGSLNINAVIDSVTVLIDFLGLNSAPNNANLLVVGTEDGTGAGIAHAMRVTANGSLVIRNLAFATDKVDVSGSSITVSSSALPTGAATEAKQDITNTKLDTLNAKDFATETTLDELNTKVITTVNGIKVDVQSSALPAGAATAARQDTGNASLSSIDSKLNTLGQKNSAGSVPVVLASDQTVNVQTQNPVVIAGTEDGTSGGTQRVIVNNLKNQILAAHDRLQSFTYADFGTKDERITAITYTSPTFLGHTATKSISYTLVGNKYRRDTITWNIT